MNKETGEPLPPLDAATQLQAEAEYLSFFAVQADPNPAAQGLADFE